MISELQETYGEVVSDGCRALILRSSMRHFCAGAEISYFSETSIQADGEALEAFMSTLEDIPISTVAAVNGGALGGGLEMALCCDMIISADTAFLGQTEVIVGPDSGAWRNAAARTKGGNCPCQRNCDVWPPA